MRLDTLIITVLLLISLLGVMYELNGLQKFRVEVERERLQREIALVSLNNVAFNLGKQVSRLSGVGWQEPNCRVCH